MAREQIALCGRKIWVVLKNLQSEIAPMEDRNSVRFTVTLPEGASYSYTQAVTDQIGDYLMDSIPERDFVFTRLPMNGAVNTSAAKDRSGRAMASQAFSQNEIHPTISRAS